ncbi:MAG: hypothetical protein WDW36_003041 [Sanguina aurantia]
MVNDANNQISTPTTDAKAVPAPSSPASTATSTTGASSGNPLLAGGAFALAILLFAGGRLLDTQPTLGSLERAAIPFEVAMSNGKPTVVEFYANW